MATQLFVPGRVCLFGEHSDWAGGHRRTNADLEKGYAIIVGTNQGIYATVSAHPDSVIISSTTNKGTKIGPHVISMNLEILLAEAQKSEFWSYIAGVSHYMLARYGVRGIEIDNFKTDLPVKKGLSSSAAVCVLAARAFNRVYKLGLSTEEEMEAAYQGEILTNSRCGRMDQGCAFGEKPILMVFDGDDLKITPLNVGADIHMVIVDLHGKKDTKKILAALNNSFPFSENEFDVGLQSLLGEKNKSVVDQAVKFMNDGAVQSLGQLMSKAQELFDLYAQPACPDELLSPMLHTVLQLPALQPLVWGGKGVGSQGDGSAQLIVRSQADQLTSIEIFEKQLGMGAIPLTIKKSKSC